jgi:hypothetical protein
MKVVAKYYDRHGTANEKMLAHYLLGCTYRDLNDVPLSLDCLNMAVDKAEISSSDCDYKLLSRIYNQKAELFEYQDQPKKQLQELRKAEKYALLGYDTLNAVIMYNHQRGVYNMIGQQDSAIIVNNKSIKSFYHIHHPEAAAMAYGANALYYAEKKDYRKAAKCINIYENQSGVFHEGKIEKGSEFYYFIKGEYYRGVGKIDSAKIYYKLLLFQSASISDKYNGAKTLCDIYEQESDADSTAKYAVLCNRYLTSIYFEHKKSNILKIQAMYDYNVATENNLKLEDKAKVTKYLIYIIILFIIIIAIITLNYHNKKKKEFKDLSIAQNDLKRLLSNDEDKLQDMIKEKEMYIEILKNRTEKKQEEELKIKIDNANRTLKKSDIGSKFYHSITKRQIIITENDWLNLQIAIEEVAPSFINTITLNTELNEKELRICFLSKLRMSNKDISSILEANPSDISQLRRKLMNKIFHKNGSPKDFDNVIKAII